MSPHERVYSCSRRDLLRSSAISIAALCGGQAAFGQPAARAPEFDLLLTGARVMDPARGLDRIADVAVGTGKIAAVEPSIAPERAARVIPVKGCLVTPGLVDIHVHGFRGVSHAGVELDTYCIGRGVTTAVDAGTSGADSFAGFRRHVIAPASTRVLAFLNISRIGLISPLGELVDRRMIDREAALRACREHANEIVGIKVRCTHFYSGPNDLEAVQAARAVGEATGKPLMVHTGWPHTPFERLLDELRAGDIVTHAFRGAGEGGVIGPDGRVSPAIRRAAKRGVLFDVGHGSGSFSFQAVEAALREDFPPSSISSDIHAASVLGPVFDMVTTMSKLLMLGLPLGSVIERSTALPARSIQRSHLIGSLEPGRPADITVLQLVNGEFEMTDSKRQVRTAASKLVPILALRDGRAALE
ncbi:MAG: amidohydrolase/deacetylase family metallohydrolase [Acidobacteria bacterium]|nr:amidohydrolase/deacetylase family metallohydrolase [Acidobacteriota bacterium]